MAIEHLTAREKALLEEWQKDRKKPSLATSLSVKLFELFLHGVDCNEISRINNGNYLVEQILEARVRDQWDERRNEYLDSLFGGIVQKVSQAQAEAVEFLADMLAVAHKMHGHKLKEYLQTGDEKKLGDFKINGWQNYKGVVDSLLKITGQDRDRDPGAPKTPKDLQPTTPASAPQAQRLLPAGGVQIIDASSAASILGALSDDTEPQ